MYIFVRWRIKHCPFHLAESYISIPNELPSLNSYLVFLCRCLGKMQINVLILILRMFREPSTNPSSSWIKRQRWPSSITYIYKKGICSVVQICIVLIKKSKHWSQYPLVMWKGPKQNTISVWPLGMARQSEFLWSHFNCPK